MKNSQLIELLSTFPKDTTVLTYIGGVEEYGHVENAELFNDEDSLPYAKGDKPAIPTGGLLVISGYSA